MLGACCFLFANFQYTFLALTFCQSFGVYRQPVYANWRVGGLFVLQFTLSTLLVLFEWENFGSAFSIVYPPFEYRVKLVILALVNGALHMLYERIAVPHESDDEEPVLDMDELEDALDQFNGFKRIPRANSGVDCQPTVLPKLRSRAPLYHQLGVLARPMWSATAP